MTVSAGDDDVGSLSDRLAHALRGDSTVRLGWLHGSRARGTARRESDIDVAVLLDDERAASPSAIKDSIWRLAGALGREVPSDRLDLVLLNHAPALRATASSGTGYCCSRAPTPNAYDSCWGRSGSIRIWNRVFASTPAAGWSGSRRDGQMVDTEIFSRRVDALESYLGRLRSLGEAAEPFSGRLLRMVRLHLVPSLM